MTDKFDFQQAGDIAWAEARRGKTEEELRDEHPRDKVLTRNAARCLECGDEIESTHRHDFRTCSCGSISVDGGLSYAKRTWREGCSYLDLCEYREETPEEYEGRIRGLVECYRPVTDEMLKKAAEVIRHYRSPSEDQ